MNKAQRLQKGLTVALITVLSLGIVSTVGKMLNDKYDWIEKTKDLFVKPGETSEDSGSEDIPPSIDMILDPQPEGLIRIQSVDKAYAIWAEELWFDEGIYGVNFSTDIKTYFNTDEKPYFIDLLVSDYNEFNNTNGILQISNANENVIEFWGLAVTELQLGVNEIQISSGGEGNPIFNVVNQRPFFQSDFQ